MMMVCDAADVRRRWMNLAATAADERRHVCRVSWSQWQQIRGVAALAMVEI
jgi:hypothetical protein